MIVYEDWYNKHDFFTGVILEYNPCAFHSPSITNFKTKIKQFLWHIFLYFGDFKSISKFPKPGNVARIFQRRSVDH